MSDGNKINLLQMQKYFEGQMERIRTISDLELSENDFKSLGVKLRSLCFFTGSENDIDDFMLSIAVYSSYALIYGAVGSDFENIIWMVMNNSQYMERMHLSMLKNVYDSYGLNTFDVDDPDLMSAVRKLVALHAGIPNCDKNMYYDILSDYLSFRDVSTMLDEIYARLPERSRYIYGFMDKAERERMILDSRSLVNDVVDGLLDRNELVNKHSTLSLSLIDRCLMWNETGNQIIRYRVY